MILTDRDILYRVKAGNIEISDFSEDRLGSNSYDLRLGDELLTYNELSPEDRVHVPGKGLQHTVLDVKKNNPYTTVAIPEDGTILMPGELYLGYTIEKTKSPDLVPQLEGKSSLARLGLQVHMTAGFGDIGFEGHWTLEMIVVRPLRIYAGMPVAQVYFIVPLGVCDKPYNRKKNAKYTNQAPSPVPSQMWKNFPLK